VVSLAQRRQLQLPASLPLALRAAAASAQAHAV
jgi:hypothetical protein